jgi:hypothetical protein
MGIAGGAVILIAASLLLRGALSRSGQPPAPERTSAQRAARVQLAEPVDASSSDQQCGGITDPFCYVIDAFVSGPIAIMGSLDGSPDPSNIAPSTGAVIDGPWHLITTLVGSNPVVDNYDGSLGERAHECGANGCIPWVQKLNSILVPISLSLLVVAFAVQVSLFMAGQQLNLRAGIVPCLVAAAVIGAGLPLHLAGRVIDLGAWLSQGVLQQSFHALGGGPEQPLDMMTVLAMAAYCPEDSPIARPGIHISMPGSSLRQQVLVDPWMDPKFTQSHCISSSSPDFTEEVLDRSRNIFGPPLHDANCDRGDDDPGQPLCTDTDQDVNDNQGQECLEGSGSDLGTPQLNLLPLPGEPRADNGQSPANCRYADIYWGTVSTFTDVWKGVGPHGRNGYDVPDGIQGMVAFTVLTVLALWLAMTYLARYIVLALLAGCASLAFLLLAFPGGRPAFNRYWRTVAELSAVVVVQTLIFLAFLAVVTTVSGLAPVGGGSDCPLISPAGVSHCLAGAQGLLADVGSGNPGAQFAKCLLAIVAVWLMLEVPRRLSRGEMSTYHGLRSLAATSGGVVLGGALLIGSEGGPRAARFGAQISPTVRSALGKPTRQDHDLARDLERAEAQGGARWPQVRGAESREQFIGRAVLHGEAGAAELGRLLQLDRGQLGQLRADAAGDGQAAARRRETTGRDYVNAGGSLVHELDAAYLNSVRRGRLRRDPRADLGGDG